MLIHVGYPKLYSEYVRNNGSGSLSTYLDPLSRDRFPVFDLRYWSAIGSRFATRSSSAPTGSRSCFSRTSRPTRSGSPARCSPSQVRHRSTTSTRVPSAAASVASGCPCADGRTRSSDAIATNRVARLHVPGVAKAIESIDAHAPDSVQARVAERHRRLIADRVGERYRASNQRLAERFALDLAAKGYDT